MSDESKGGGAAASPPDAPARSCTHRHYSMSDPADQRWRHRPKMSRVTFVIERRVRLEMMAEAKKHGQTMSKWMRLLVLGALQKRLGGDMTDAVNSDNEWEVFTASGRRRGVWENGRSRAHAAPPSTDIEEMDAEL